MKKLSLSAFLILIGLTIGACGNAENNVTGEHEDTGSSDVVSYNSSTQEEKGSNEADSKETDSDETGTEDISTADSSEEGRYVVTMDELFPDEAENGIEIEDISQTVSSETVHSEKEYQFWEMLGENVVEPDSRIVLEETLELPYSSNQLAVFDFDDQNRINEADTDTEELIKDNEYWANALIYPQKRPISQDAYYCLIQTSKGAFDAEDEFADLVENESDILKFIIDDYDSMIFIEHNEITYGVLMYKNGESKHSVRFITVVKGVLFEFIIDFSEEYYDEFNAFQNYLLDSIERINE